jgi:hypothetical protein
MKPILINDYCFDRIHIWIQYDVRIPQFIEVVIEVFYPSSRDANGLVMFSHGFLIGNDLLFYPKKLVGTFLNDNPLFGINPSYYYNFTPAIVENRWALAFVTAAHMQNAAIPWLDFGGNPRAGQDAYAAASYLIRYGATDFFYKADEHNRGSSFYDRDLVTSRKFMKNNRVIFAGHSIGGGHAQAAATGFDTLRKLGPKNYRPFDPVIFDREVLPAYSERMSRWRPEERAEPVGLLQLSPVDQQIPLLAPGMQFYREALSRAGMPNLMIVGKCDCACLEKKYSKPPAWSGMQGTVSQFEQMAPAGGSSWAAVAMVDRGSHCGYLTQPNNLCSLADGSGECDLCPGEEVYRPAGRETAFTTELLKRFIALYPREGGGPGGFDDWAGSGFMQWLNRESPDGSVKLVPFSDGSHVHFSRKGGA